MNIADYFPVWEKLTPAEQAALEESAVDRCFPAGARIHNGSEDCVGLLLMRSGQLRAYINSEEGKEITLYRLFERDICLLSASCMVSSIQFDITIEAEKDSEVWIISAATYKSLMEQSAVLANYTNQIMAERFTEVMWLIEQIMWKSFDKRLAQFLTEEAALEESDRITTTHEKIANHMGTAREVVTRMLRYFQSEGMVRVSRGEIRLLDEKRLRALAGD
jgi:CRP/FNR family transcriptional regulator